VRYRGVSDGKELVLGVDFLVHDGLGDVHNLHHDLFFIVFEILLLLDFEIQFYFNFIVAVAKQLVFCDQFKAHFVQIFGLDLHQVVEREGLFLVVPEQHRVRSWLIWILLVLGQLDLENLTVKHFFLCFNYFKRVFNPHPFYIWSPAANEAKTLQYLCGYFFVFFVVLNHFVILRQLGASLDELQHLRTEKLDDELLELSVQVRDSFLLYYENAFFQLVVNRPIFRLQHV
jgi:hypothetical protein